MSSQDDPNALLREGIELARTGQHAQARAIFEQIIQADEYNEMAWMWMATVAENDPQRREALEIVLEINPANAEAREALNRLGGPRARRKAAAAQELAERIGGEAADEATFQPLAARPPEPAAPEPEPAIDPEAREAALDRRLIEAVHADTAAEAVAAGDEADEAAEGEASGAEPAQVVEYIDFRAIDRRRQLERLARWVGWIALVLVGAGLVAVLLLGLAQLSTPPLPTSTPTPGLQTALAALITPSATISPTPEGIIVVTRETREAAFLPPTWTPSHTPSPTASYTPSPTPLAPDAYMLIFSRRAEGAERYSLYTIRGDGAQLQRLTGDATDDRGPAPASDGRRVVFVSDQRGGRELMLAELDTLATPAPTGVPSPTGEAVPPDGAEATPPADEGTPLATGALQVITTLGGRRTGAPSWSSDGFRIAFSAEVDGDEEVFIVNADGSGFAQLTDNTAIADRDPAWSPNGQWIVFASDRDGANEFELYHVRPNGTELERLTDSAGSSFEPSWSPDSASIAFVSDRDRDADLYVMNADGSNERLLTLDDGAAEDRYPAWSPDGRWIAFSSNRETANFQLYLIDPTGARIERVTQGSGDDVDPAWLR